MTAPLWPPLASPKSCLRLISLFITKLLQKFSLAEFLSPALLKSWTSLIFLQSDGHQLSLSDHFLICVSWKYSDFYISYVLLPCFWVPYMKEWWVDASKAFLEGMKNFMKLHYLFQQVGNRQYNFGEKSVKCLGSAPAVSLSQETAPLTWILDQHVGSTEQ